MDSRIIVIAFMVVMCMITVGVGEYKVKQIPEGVLITPQEVLDELFDRRSVIVPNEDKSALEMEYGVDNGGSVRLVSRGVPRDIDNSFKSYMDFRKITNKSSKQFEMQSMAWTDGFGYRRYNNFYMVAMGSYYSTNLGDKFKITFDTGKSIMVMLSECKQDIHTDKLNQYNPFNSNVIEFIVDVDILHPLALKMGDVSYGNDELKGKITKIEQIMEE